MNKRLSKAFGILFLLIELLLVPKALELMLEQPLFIMRPLEIITLAMTFGSIALCIVMSFSSMSENDSYPLHTFLFELMVFLCALAPMTDFFTKALDHSGRPGLNMLVNTVYYLIGVSIAYTVLRYEYLITCAARKPLWKKLLALAGALTALDALATLLNIRFGFFFTIGADGMYQSAPCFWLAYLVPALLIVLIAWVAASEMRPGRQRRAFQFFWVFAFLSSLLQFIWTDFSIQYTGYTLSLIVICINVQSELDSPAHTNAESGGPEA